MHRRALAAMLMLVALGVLPIATCGPAEGTTSEKLADPSDVRATAVVQLVDGAYSERNGSLPTTRPACTGTLVSPRLVLTAAHCFGVGPAGGPDRGVRGGDEACVVLDASGAVVATGGCGEVVFTDVTGKVREVQTVRRAFASRGTARDGITWPHGGDLALAQLDHRATADTRAHATPIRPWLDDDLPADAWRGRSVLYFGWGDEGPLVAEGSACSPLTGSEPARALHYWDESPLDPTTPVVDAPMSGLDQGGAMFLQTFDAFGDVSGFLHQGDSGAAMLTLAPNGGLRAVGVASMHWCDKDLFGCEGSPLRLTGVLQNVWARTMDARSGNRAFLRMVAMNPDGTLFGDDVPNPGCSADPPSPDPGDPDCDLVPTTGTSFRPADDCPSVYDPDQADRDGDGLGDACEGVRSSAPLPRTAGLAG